MKAYKVWEDGDSESQQIEAYNPGEAAVAFVVRTHGPVAGMGGELPKYRVWVFGDGAPGLLYQVQADWNADRIIDASPTDPPVVVVVSEEIVDIPPSIATTTTDDLETSTTDDGIRTSSTTDAPEEG